MIKKDNSNPKDNCKIHVMPPTISDEDISVLLNGIIGIVKRKVELESQADIINLNINISKLQKEIKQKTAECNRLKNEILFLKTQIKEQNNTL